MWLQTCAMCQRAKRMDKPAIAQRSHTGAKCDRGLRSAHLAVPPWRARPSARCLRDDERLADVLVQLETGLATLPARMSREASKSHAHLLGRLRHVVLALWRLAPWIGCQLNWLWALAASSPELRSTRSRTKTSARAQCRQAHPSAASERSRSSAHNGTDVRAHAPAFCAFSAAIW